jgi:hypothetical protein
MTNRSPSSAAQTGPTIHRKMTTGPDDEGLIVVRKLVIRGWPVVHTVHSPSAMVTACRFVGKRCRGRATRFVDGVAGRSGLFWCLLRVEVKAYAGAEVLGLAVGVVVGVASGCSGGVALVGGTK